MLLSSGWRGHARLGAPCFKGQLVRDGQEPENALLSSRLSSFLCLFLNLSPDKVFSSKAASARKPGNRSRTADELVPFLLPSIYFIYSRIRRTDIPVSPETSDMCTSHTMLCHESHDAHLHHHHHHHHLFHWPRGHASKPGLSSSSSKDDKTNAIHHIKGSSRSSSADSTTYSRPSVNHGAAFNPLSLHPPRWLNHSPAVQPPPSVARCEEEQSGYRDEDRDSAEGDLDDDIEEYYQYYITSSHATGRLTFGCDRERQRETPQETPQGTPQGMPQGTQLEETEVMEHKEPAAQAASNPDGFPFPAMPVTSAVAADLSDISAVDRTPEPPAQRPKPAEQPLQLDADHVKASSPDVRRHTEPAAEGYFSFSPVQNRSRCYYMGGHSRREGYIMEVDATPLAQLAAADATAPRAYADHDDAQSTASTTDARHEEPASPLQRRRHTAPHLESRMEHFIKRGEWKRRGIVFDAEKRDEEEIKFA